MHVFLTGVPGVGKTTLVKKLIERLSEKTTIGGFYTEEIRSGGVRIGFDAVSMDGATRCPLARIQEDSFGHRKYPKVGKYSVFVDRFEEFAGQTIADCRPHSVFVLDEVGKMELFSRSFQSHVTRLFTRDDVTLLGTIPIRKGVGIPFVEKIRSSERVRCLQVTRENRDTLAEEVMSILAPK